ncbi:GNAT family N-acetyltransferase [Kitasatospora sp. NPDC101155]|uniref:GNAT family N-acetyltransferase n=1 Tax=Kitasatospora sp. NPDC101155 TaxID=3364097 RepID=UPI0038203C7E
MTNAAPSEIRLYRAPDLPDGFRDLLLAVHADAYADQADDPFIQRFPWFVDHWTTRPGFTCAVAYDDQGEPTGFAYGAPLPYGREWWRDHLPQEPENPSTYGLSELMVRPRWRKTGTSTALHQALLANRPEHLAVLCVDPDHPRVQALYESWGYRPIGIRQPFPDSPRYAVMLRHLPL